MLKNFFKKQSNYVAILCLGIAIWVIGSMYLMAPIYQFICKNVDYFSLVSNYLWTILPLDLFESFYYNKSFDMDDYLLLKISFQINISEDLPWVGFIDIKSSFCNIGEPILRTVRLTNQSDSTVTAIALVDIMPSEYKGYFNKQQCFCYEPIRLYPWETIYLPIVFNVLPDLYWDYFFGTSKSITVLYSFVRIGW